MRNLMGVRSPRDQTIGARDEGSVTGSTVKPDGAGSLPQ